MLGLAAPIRRAAGVEEQEPALVLQERDVRVAKDDHAGFREAAPHARPAPLFRAGVVDHGYRYAPEGELQRLRQLHVRPVQVPLDGANGGVEGELVEHRRFEQIPGVQDQVGALQVRDQLLRQALRAAGDVGVGDDERKQGDTESG